MQVNVIQIPYTYEGTDKKQHKGYNYALQLDNGKRIPINPVVIPEKDEKGNKTGVIKYDGRSDLSLIAQVVDK